MARAHDSEKIHMLGKTVSVAEGQNSSDGYALRKRERARLSAMTRPS